VATGASQKIRPENQNKPGISYTITSKNYRPIKLLKIKQDMTNKIIIFDTTLRDGEQVPGCQLNTIEKLRLPGNLKSLASMLLRQDFPISSPGDFNSVVEISKAVQNPIICGLTQGRQERY
jgi:hypothetical protein